MQYQCGYCLCRQRPEIFSYSKYSITPKKHPWCFPNSNEKELHGIGCPSGLLSGKFAHNLINMCSQKLSEKDASPRKTVSERACSIKSSSRCQSPTKCNCSGHGKCKPRDLNDLGRVGPQQPESLKPLPLRWAAMPPRRPAAQSDTKLMQIQFLNDGCPLNSSTKWSTYSPADGVLRNPQALDLSFQVSN